jgi:hypothetical protein
MKARIAKWLRVVGGVALGPPIFMAIAFACALTSTQPPLLYALTGVAVGWRWPAVAMSSGASGGLVCFALLLSGEGLTIRESAEFSLQIAGPYLLGGLLGIFVGAYPGLKARLSG